ncbi:predicted protein [Nematostella vectensis]|uniref:Exocyst complex component 7 n=1 Tax=Nematostella vectensis TaxID=45351 RepID=A7RJI8_NEMVE|nr:predicted protein [Nematostella vectensis]|eukprot:XP_001640332.1 predicted protein [Nematostella vectensis]
MGVIRFCFQSEVDLMKPIIPEDHQNAIFDKLIQAALEAFMTEGETIVNTLRKFTSKHYYASTMQVFPVLRHSRHIQPDFDDVLQFTGPKTRSKFPSLINALELAAARALDEFADGIRHAPEKHASNMPRDGTVHELTRNTLLFMEQLLPYVETVGNLLATQQGNLELRCTYFSGVTVENVIFLFAERVLGSLGLNLQLKTKVYESVTLVALFLLNNYHYILKALQRSGLLELLQKGEIYDVEKQYKELVEEQKKMYEKCWSKVLHYLLEMEKPGAASKSVEATMKLKDKQRQMIKDKFKGFNTEFEELYQIQKTYAVPDVALREEIRLKNIELIVPIYRAFRDKYEGVPFTKNPEKYVKYTADEVENLMNKFFDVSA